MVFLRGGASVSRDGMDVVNGDFAGQKFVALRTLIDPFYNVVPVDDLTESGKAQPIRMSPAAIVQCGFVTHTDKEAAIHLTRSVACGGNGVAMMSQPRRARALVTYPRAGFRIGIASANLHDVDRLNRVRPRLRAGHNAEHTGIPEGI